ncbi:hypothetical protein AAG906_022406 [Vitis piasezkii]
MPQGGSGRIETSPGPSPSNRNWVQIDEMKPSSPIAGPREAVSDGGRPHMPSPKQNFCVREDENTRKLQGGVRMTRTDRALEEESMRYEKVGGRADKSLWLTKYKARNERIKECKDLEGLQCNNVKGRELTQVCVIEDAQAMRSEMEGNWKRVVWQDSKKLRPTEVGEGN